MAMTKPKAEQVTNVPSGIISSTTVQGAINEIVSDLAAPSGASLVGYMPAGVGAIATTVQEVLRETVTVTRFGASPVNSASTNTTAINAALASGAPSVAIPNDGEYLVNGTITVPTGVSFYANGSARIKLADGSLSSSGVVLNVGSGAKVENIVVDGNRQNNTGQVSGIYALNPTGVTVTGCTVKNTEYGIRVTDGTNIVIKNNIVDDCLFYGISVKLSSTTATCYNVFITGNTCMNIASDGTGGADGQGIVVYGATGLLLANYKNINNVAVSNNICHNCAAHGIDLIAVSDFVVSGNNCYDIRQNTDFASGICISEACTNGTVVGNTCTNCYDAGILLDVVDQAGNRFLYGRMSVTGNSCDSNTRAGIKINSMPYTTISSNNCSKSRWGIFLTKGGFNTISGNNLYSCTDNGVRLTGLAGAVGDDQTNVIISDNTFSKCVATAGDQYSALFIDYFNVVKVQNNNFNGNTQDLTIQSTCSGVTLLDNRFTSNLYVDSSTSIQRWEDEFRTTAAGKSFISNDIATDGMTYFRLAAGFTLPHFGLYWVPVYALGNVTSSLVTAISPGGWLGQTLRLINYDSPTITIKQGAGVRNIGGADVVLAYTESVEFVWRGTVWLQTVAKVVTGL